MISGKVIRLKNQSPTHQLTYLLAHTCQPKCGRYPIIIIGLPEAKIQCKRLPPGLQCLWPWRVEDNDLKSAHNFTKQHLCIIIIVIPLPLLDKNNICTFLVLFWSFDWFFQLLWNNFLIICQAIQTTLTEKKLSGWLESWEGLLFVKFDNQCESYHQSQVKMNSAHVVETSVIKQQSSSKLQSHRWSFSIKVCNSWDQTMFLI